MPRSFFEGTQSSGGYIILGGNSAEEIMQQIWSFCVKFIHRAAVFNDSIHEILAASENNSPHGPPAAAVCWDEDAPAYENRNNFLSFHDKTSKRNYPPTKVDEAMLQTWISKDNLLQPLEKDRAGAESLASVNKIKAQLKANHGRYLSGDDINWGCWASWIANKPAETREHLLQQTPPEHIISLFSSVPVYSDTLLEKGRLDLQVANAINNAYSRILRDLKNDHAQLHKSSLIMAKRIALLETKHKEYDEMLRAIQNSVTATENRFSAELAQTVADCVDIDHK
ncbi:hypothetical protein RP20_CCG000605 [Aedes albopictus]|nr:hypothetical protein RP20_CCG000605 [Aedes albopictus]